MGKFVHMTRKVVLEVSRNASNYQLISLIATRLDKENKDSNFVYYNDDNGHYVLDVIFPTSKHEPKEYAASLKKSALQYKDELKPYLP